MLCVVSLKFKHGGDEQAFVCLQDKVGTTSSLNEDSVLKENVERKLQLRAIQLEKQTAKNESTRVRMKSNLMINFKFYADWSIL